MIGYLSGRVRQKQPPYLLLDVHGVGYEIEATMATFYAMPEAGSEFALYTHLIVREDAQLLYGFASETERTLFRALIKVSGVGARLALAILSGMSVNNFIRCVQARDAAALVRLPGVGKKTAERLIVEMADRLADGATVDVPVPGHDGAVAAAADDPVADAVSALIALGYKPAEASRMIREVAAGVADNREALIKAALQASVSR
jgi:Holliday junction DNA helicase RuvA